MKKRFKTKFIDKLKLMAETPKAQIKQLAIGTLISLIAMVTIVFTSQFENQILFSFLILILLLGIIYAIPGYIGIWVWRMKDTLFREK